MADKYEDEISKRLDSEVHPRERGENAALKSVGAIADALVRIANILEMIYEDGLPIRTNR
jgi:hypothetical protein